MDREGFIERNRSTRPIFFDFELVFLKSGFFVQALIISLICVLFLAAELLNEERSKTSNKENRHFKSSIFLSY